MSEARSEILARIARGTGTALGDPWEKIPRDYRRSSAASDAELVALLTHRLRDYDAQVLEASSANAAAAVAKMLKARGVSRIVVPAGLQSSLLPTGFEFIEDVGLSHSLS